MAKLFQVTETKIDSTTYLVPKVKLLGADHVLEVVDLGSGSGSIIRLSDNNNHSKVTERVVVEDKASVLALMDGAQGSVKALSLLVLKDESGDVGSTVKLIPVDYILEVESDASDSIVTLTNTSSSKGKKYTVQETVANILAASNATSAAIGGSGTTNTIPLFTGATALGDSVITWDGESFTASLLSGFFRFDDGSTYIQIFPNVATIKTNDSYLILEGSKGVQLTDSVGFAQSTAKWEAGTLTLLESVGGGLLEIRSLNGNIEFTESGGGLQKISFAGGVGAYTYTLPSATGTLALVTDIPAPSLINTNGTTAFVNPNETINCTAGTFPVNLPTAVGIQGRVYILVNSGTGVITLDPNGAETINGNTTITLTQYVSRTVQSDGNNWIII